MGISKLSWQEIESWLNVMQYRLTDWEKLTVRRLSEEYAAEYNQASDKTRKAPFMADEIDRGLVANKIGNILGGLAAKTESKYEIEE